MTSPPRVAFVTSHLGPGGAERHVAMLSPALQAAGHDVMVVCVESEGHFGPTMRSASVALTDLGLGRTWKRHPVRAVSALRHSLRTFRPDVVMTNGFSAEVLTRQALRRLPRTALAVWKHNSGHLGHYGLRDRWAERLPGATVQRYLAVSHGQLPYLRDSLRLDPARTQVVHNSVPAQPPAPLADPAALRVDLGLTDGGPVVACVGALRREKDHPTLLHAFAKVVQRSPEAQLLLIGDGPSRPDLVRLTEALGIRDAVHFLGVRDDVADLLQLVDVVTLASTTIENFPFAVLEAMAASVPAVCTAVGGLPELVEDGVSGLLVAPGRPDALAAALLTLVADPARRRRMGDAARQRLIVHFPFDGMVSRVQQHLEDLATARPHDLRGTA